MRSFAFAVFDIDNSILDRFPLDVVTDLSGLGWRLKLSTLEGGVTDKIKKGGFRKAIGRSDYQSYRARIRKIYDFIAVAAKVFRAECRACT